MRARRHRSVWQRTETWLWTGPVGHLVGGALDLVQAVAVYAISRVRGRRERPGS